MKILHKMLLAPLSAMACLLLIGLLFYLSMQAQDKRLLQIKEQNFAEFSAASQQTILMSQLHSEIYGHIAIMASLDDAAVQRISSDFVQRSAAIKSGFASVIQADTETAKSFENHMQAYQKAVLTALEMGSMDPNTGIASMQTATTEYQAVKDLLMGLNTALAAQTSDLIAHSRSSNQRMLALIIVCVVVVSLLLSLSAVWLARSVSLPLRQAIQIAEKVAAGELHDEIKVDRQDEIGQLLMALAEMKRSLLAVVKEVRRGTEHIARSAATIAASSTDLAQRSHQQSQSLESTTASMLELTTTVQQNEASAHNASSRAHAACEMANQGGQVVSRAVATMQEINQASSRIGDIIGLIDGIAFQTNILALNAAVEAARAGEQGRGFAVVATEVRSLAQRSAGAANEIKHLIHNSLEHVDAGAALVEQTGQMMQQIVSSIENVNVMINEMTQAGQQQSNKIKKAGMDVTTIDELNHQNVNLIDSAASEAQELHREAETLLRVVSKFHI